MAKDALRFLGIEPGTVDYTCSILDKETGIFHYVQYMFDRTNRMFRYNGLPDTIPEYILEYMLQIYGSVAIIKHNGELYSMRANYGGPPDPYYRPTEAVIANPALAIGKSYAIVNNLPPFESDYWSTLDHCIWFRSDTQAVGLMPLFSRYAVQMVENDVSIRCAQINLRQQTIIAADTGPEAQSANEYMENLEAGKLAAIAKKPFLDGIKVMNAGNSQTNAVMQLIELQQYLKASWYNEIGLNSNFNMKRQYVSSEEINSTADIMLPLIDDMFNMRKLAVEAINSEFGTSITVEKDSAWEKKQLQSDMSVTPDTGGPIDPMEPEDFSSVDENDEKPIETKPEDKKEVKEKTEENTEESTSDEDDSSNSDKEKKKEGEKGE